MNQIDRAEFNFSVHGLDYDEVLGKYSYGIRRYYMQEDCLDPYGEYKQIICRQSDKWAQDIRVASKALPRSMHRDNKDFFPVVMSSQMFQDYVYGLMQNGDAQSSKKSFIVKKKTH
jgi:hypothetical protein